MPVKHNQVFNISICYLYTADIQCKYKIVYKEGDKTLRQKNFDWNPCDALIVESKPESGYASIDFTQGISFSSLPDETKALIALYAPLDGMNEKGLTVSVNMRGNAAANTLLNYLSDSPLLFPTYSYNEDAGFVGQVVRESYTRDDEVTVTDVKCGELYLFSNGQLRLYFKGVPGANITATPVGVFADPSVVNDAVKSAYKSNKGDTWGIGIFLDCEKLRGKRRYHANQ